MKSLTSLSKPQSFAIIGAGRIGTAVAVTLAANGFRFIGAFDQHSDKPPKLIATVGQGTVLYTLEEALQAEIVWLTVNDDALAIICQGIANTDAIHNCTTLIHTSGVNTRAVFEVGPLQQTIGLSIHPLTSITTSNAHSLAFSGTPMAVEAADEHLEFAFFLARALGGVPFRIFPAQKPLYHAGAVIVSNFMLGLFYAAETMWRTIGLEGQADGDHLWRQLATRTLSNAISTSPQQALTGPLARGDSSAIAQHRLALCQAAPHIWKWYREISLFILHEMKSCQDLPSQTIEVLENLLSPCEPD